MDSFITRGEFEPVKAKATAAKGLAEGNKKIIDDICASQMKFKETNNQEHTNMLIAITKVADGNAGMKEEVVGMRSDFKKATWAFIGFLVSVVISLIVFIAKSGVL